MNLLSQCGVVPNKMMQRSVLRAAADHRNRLAKHMPQPDWYRRTSWSKGERTEFEAKLARSRGSRSEYLRIQALCLASTRKKRLAVPAVDLSARYLEENPDGLLRAGVFSALGLAYSTLGKWAEATEAYRSAVDAELVQPNVRGYCYLDFAWFVATHDLVALYDEATGAIEAGIDEWALNFPVNRLRYFGALAIFAEHLGDDAQMRSMASKAMDAAGASEGPFPHYPELGVVTKCKRKILDRLSLMISEEAAPSRRWFGRRG